MMMPMTDDCVTILHNPRCTKSRQALALIAARGFKPRIVEYLKNPLEAEDLHALLDSLGLSARQLLRTKENIYKELGLDDPKYSDDELIHIMLQHPILIERPIVSYRGKAVIGRPPEAVSTLLD
jgi:arsenate reductase (glutaredoxin)